MARAAVRVPPVRIGAERVELPHVAPAIPPDLVRHAVELAVGEVAEVAVRGTVLVPPIRRLNPIHPTFNVSHVSPAHKDLQSVLLIGAVAAVVPALFESGGAGRGCDHGGVVAAGFHPVWAAHGGIACAHEHALVEVGDGRHVWAGAGWA